jgi:hypothetical protein
MAGGRPRKVPERDELIELGKDLVEWSKNPNSWRYPEWYTQKGLIDTQWNAMILHDEFLDYYQTCRANLARRYIDGTINPSIAHRFLRHYVSEVKEEENEELEFKAKLAKETLESTIPDDVLQRYEHIVKELKSKR